MKKVLINAYAVRPNSGSEGGLAWNWISGLASNYEVFVITEGEWRDEIEAVLKKSFNSGNIHFYYIPVSERVRRMCWNQGDYRFYYYYAKWQKKALEIARKITRENRIELIHQLNMIGFREPGYLWKITAIPFVWGPIGGMNMVPLSYLQETSILTRIKYGLKNAVSEWQYRHHPRVRKIIKRADVLIAANKASYDVLTELHPEKKLILLNETGCRADRLVNRLKNDGNEFNILWVGRFIPTKLLTLSLQVIEQLKSLPGLKFHIVGQAFNANETKRYHQLARDMGLDKICKWYGWVSHDAVQELMQQCDVFFFPSVVEGTPHVVLEAIANKLPIVCFDTCGQAEAVNDCVGRKIPLSSPNESVQGFKALLKELYMNRTLLNTLSANCEQRRYELSWDNKVKKMMDIYNQLIVGPIM